MTSTFVDVHNKWNLGRLSDKLGESVTDPNFDELEGSGNRHKLDSRFNERTLVYVSLSRAQLDDDSE